MAFTSFSRVRRVVDNEDAAVGGPPTTTTTIGGEATAARNDEVKVYATEEQIRAVFSNGLVI